MESNFLPFEALCPQAQQAINSSSADSSPIFITQQDEKKAVLLSYSAYTRILTQEAENLHKWENAYVDLLLSLANDMDSHESYAPGHSARLAILACDTAAQLGCSPEEVEYIRWAALLHDIGEILIPTKVLQKKLPLNDMEWDIIRQHSVVGAEFVAKMPHLVSAVNLIRGHHERYDGSGYPDGLKGEEIPLGARIISIVDAYDAMTNLRMHREHGEHDHAVEEIQRCSGTAFDPRVVRAFLDQF